MANKALPHLSELEQLLECNPTLGLLRWKPRAPETFAEPYRAKTWNARYSGKAALNHINVGGYRCGHVNGVIYLAHRIIWAMHHRADPGEMEIDHINGEKSDNRISNLRAVPHSENGKNQKKASNNTSGVNGVHLLPSGSWHVRITKSGLRVSVGTFKTLEMAKSAQRAAMIDAGFHPNHGR